jgi:hypothetical protein
LLPLAAEEAVGNRFVGEDEAVRDFDSPRPPTREQVVNLVESEAARLPEELRRPFFGVVRMYLNSGHTSVIGRKLYGWEPGTDRQSSPTLRLIVEIIRVWG